MTKCIVCDLDGTLLPHHTPSIQQNTLDLLDGFSAQGITVAVATGRSYVQAKKLLAKLKHPIYYICCDGGVTIYKEETIAENAVSPKKIPENSNAIGYGKYVAYATANSQPFYREALKAYHNHVLPMEEAQNIYKIALKNAPLQNIAGLDRVYKDTAWQEFVKSGVNKGTALSALQKRLHIQADETYIFGDGQNDIPMTPFGKSTLIGNGFAGWQNYFSKQFADIQSALRAIKEEQA